MTEEGHFDVRAGRRGAFSATPPMWAPGDAWPSDVANRAVPCPHKSCSKTKSSWPERSEGFHSAERLGFENFRFVARPAANPLPLRAWSAWWLAIGNRLARGRPPSAARWPANEAAWYSPDRAGLRPEHGHLQRPNSPKQAVKIRAEDVHAGRRPAPISGKGNSSRLSWTKQRSPGAVAHWRRRLPPDGGARRSSAVAGCAGRLVRQQTIHGCSRCGRHWPPSVCGLRGRDCR